MKIEQLSTHYRGRISFMELWNMPCSMLQILDKMQTEEGKKEIEAGAVEYALEEGGLIP